MKEKWKAQEQGKTDKRQKTEEREIPEDRFLIVWFNYYILLFVSEIVNLWIAFASHELGTL